NLAQFWDGRAADLEEQASGPINNHVEMGSNWAEVIGKLRRDPQYPALFAALYRDGITAAAIQNALAEFEHSLITINSPFDRYLQGDEKAINTEARQGYALFQSYGCIACHQGRNVGGNLFQKMGAVGNYFKDRGNIQKVDLGRYNVTGRQADMHYFKVPSLRLAALGGPYFHDGSATTLDSAILTMGRYQLGREIPPSDRRKIQAFLKSLVGEHRLLKK
ncbi:MAG: cytochrome-c peroxidase, partial [Leptospiraceae bacterium]|nr:cytochrome-c peroxidase [Leptospiraceae bacterium]